MTVRFTPAHATIFGKFCNISPKRTRLALSAWGERFSIRPRLSMHDLISAFATRKLPDCAAALSRDIRTASTTSWKMPTSGSFTSDILRGGPSMNKSEFRMQIALFQPDIPQNTGTILRLCACLDMRAHLIQPAGFPLSDRTFRRAGMDYLDQVTWMRHDSWTRFEEWRRGEGFRLLLFTTKAAVSYLDFRYSASDILLFGRETIGVTDEVVAAADARLKIPMKPALRSLNVAMAAAMAAGEALRQTR